MKRKDFEDINEDFSSPSIKCRRLDGELLPWFQGDPRASVPKVNEEGGLPLDPSVNSTSIVQTNGRSTDAMPLVNNSDQMAMVLYSPPATTPFLKTPTSSEFPIILNSNLVPMIKDHIFWPRNSITTSLMEDELTPSEGRKPSDDSLALVPWVDPRQPLANITDGASSLAEPMEAEETEMMDLEDSDTGNREWKGHQTAEAGDGLQQWQHCMTPPQLLQNTFNPVTW